MARRKYHHFRRCTHEGCKDGLHYEYGTRRDYSAALERFNKDPYLCSKHNPNAGNLQPDSLERTETIIVSCEIPDKEDYPLLHQKGVHTWSNGSSKANSTMTNMRWNADAEDFPIGAKIVITTTVKVVID